VIALAGVLVLAIATPAHADEAKKLFAKASKLYKKGDYAAAARAFEKLHALDKSVPVLFAWAQSERLSGNCPRAIDLYDKLIELDLTPANRDAVEKNKAECEKSIGSASQTPPPAPEPTPSPPDPDPPAPDSAPTTTKPVPTTEAPTPAPTPVDTPRTGSRPWYTDPIGLSALDAGAVGIGLGVYFYSSGQSINNDAEATDSYVEYLELKDKAQSRGRLGVITGGAGLALVGAGIVYYALLRPAPVEKQDLVTAWISGDGGGIAFTGDF
jgi:tetratricopeptide (TPR) repeat protein